LVLLQSLRDLLISPPIDQARMMVPDQHGPFFTGKLDRALPDGTVRSDLSHGALSSVRIRPRIGRVSEDSLDGIARGFDPAKGAAGSTDVPTGNLDVVLSQPQRHLTSASEVIERVEDDPQYISHLPIRRQLDPSRLPFIARGKRDLQLAATCFVDGSLMQSLPNRVPLELGDRAFEAEDHPVVEMRGIVQTVLVSEQRVRQAAEPDQPLPIGVVAREPRSFDGEHDSHLPESDLAHHPRET
jgi:hypothetical protein